ncbi:MAG: hypothetical protein EOP49_10270 [Sphingobacteriales bacterium]|nr:MAG: hypothetical protein EOP49_10270 [Sphingobacteriales bacterium]
MTDHPDEAAYQQEYGQQYSYKGEGNNGRESSGVATYEPLGSKENPLVEPFYDRAHSNSLLAPEATNYVELPFGESFYPSPKVTYSRVTVRNLPRPGIPSGSQTMNLTKHATGSTVTEFYTSYDYPTISDFTKVDPRHDPSPLGSILGIYARTHISLTQGFSIHTNDMDGKMKAQWVYAEGQSTPISGVEYKYDQNTNPDVNSGKLDNYVTTVNAQGQIADKLVGVDFDVVNDFRENNSTTETPGIHFNTEGLPLAVVFVIVPCPLPSFKYHENVLRTAVTTKVIHTTGILRETIAHDLGAAVSTKNLAWDAESGEVILTQTVNEYNDNYFNFNFPAYWAYKGMSEAALNLGLEWRILNVPGTLSFKFAGDAPFNNASQYLSDGDELYITSPINKKGFKAWVVASSANSFRLIDSNGMRVSAESIPPEGANIKVIKSANSNMQGSLMASVTSMRNPLYDYDADGVRLGMKSQMDSRPYLSTGWSDFRIVNASAIEYSDVWPSQCGCGLPKMTYNSDHQLTFEFDNLASTDDIDIIAEKSYNPYLYNVVGNWRAVKSYAYLTGRNTTGATPRKNGFYNDFGSFYKFDGTKWIVDPDSFPHWTFASEVSKYNVYGVEVENEDALHRYSSAYYGYNNRFPVAVAANTQYKELGYDGFEDYSFSECTTGSHFSFQETLTPHAITITDKEAHTGRRSIRLEPGKVVEGVATPNIASIQKKVIPCGPVTPPPAEPLARHSAQRPKAGNTAPASAQVRRPSKGLPSPNRRGAAVKPKAGVKKRGVVRPSGGMTQGRKIIKK